MLSLKEKKILLKLNRALNLPVDENLVQEIEAEEAEEALKLEQKAKQEKREQEKKEKLKIKYNINAEDFNSELLKLYKEEKEKQKKEEELINKFDALLSNIGNQSTTEIENTQINEIEIITVEANTVETITNTNNNNIETAKISNEEINIEKIENSTIVEKVVLESNNNVSKTNENIDNGDLLVANVVKQIYETSTTKNIETKIETATTSNREIKDIEKKLKYLEDWLYKVSLSGSGSGEVRLEFLDDVDRTSAKVSGKYLKYDGSLKKWVGATAGGGTGGASVTISTTAPLGASEGDLWWSINDEQLYIYYNTSWYPATNTSIIFDQANTARNQANTGYTQANAAYDQANVANIIAISSFAVANAALPNSGNQTFYGNLVVTGALTIGTNTVFIDGNAGLIIADTLQLGTLNVNQILYTSSEQTNIANYAFEQANVASQIANAAFDKANLNTSSSNSIVYISDTAPDSSVANGFLWWNSDDGTMYINYNDGNSKQWVVTNPFVSAVTNATTTSSNSIVYISDTAPDSSVANGFLWWNSSDGTLYISYGDTNSKQWVVTNPFVSAVTNATTTSSNSIVYISDTAPDSSIANGFLWWNSSDGTLYISYGDANSKQWVVTNPFVSSTANANNDAFITKSKLKEIVAASSDFADFKTRIASL